MASPEPSEVDSPDLETVLDALHDAACRTILQQTAEPKTAKELTEVCDIPESTLYRKLELLSEAALVREHVEIRDVGRHATRYERDCEEIAITFEGDEIHARIDLTSKKPDERLAYLWSEMRDHT